MEGRQSPYPKNRPLKRAAPLGSNGEEREPKKQEMITDQSNDDVLDFEDADLDLAGKQCEATTTATVDMYSHYKKAQLLHPLPHQQPPVKEGAKHFPIDLGTRPEPVFHHILSDLHAQEYYKEIPGIIRAAQAGGEINRWMLSFVYMLAACTPKEDSALLVLSSGTIALLTLEDVLRLRDKE